MVGCALVFVACVLIKSCASAVCEFTSPSATTGLQSVQPQYRAPTELQTLTPSTPSITPTTPSTVPSGEVTSPTVPRREVTPSVSEDRPSTRARSERRASFEKTRSVHHHRARATPVTYRCGNFGCIHTEAWAFPCQYYSTYCPYSYYRYGGW